MTTALAPASPMSARSDALAAPSVPAAAAADWASTEPWIAYGRTVLIGLGIVALIFGFVSISGAVVATGTVAVDGSTKTVQHLDGGIVRRIHVKDGDLVHEGDVLVTLDDTQIKANLAAARGRAVDALTQQLRLEAERDGRPTFELPASLADMGDPQLSRMFVAQHALFVARLTSRLGERSVLGQRVAQLQNDLDGLEQQQLSRKRELDYVERELASVLPLYERGFINQGRIGPLQRDAARLQGDDARLVKDVEKAKGALAEAKLKLEQSSKDFASSVAEELRRAVAQYNEAREAVSGLEDKLVRTLIRAPRSGHINALAVTTEGGIIQAGAAIAQIVPEDEKLVVSVRIQPSDIDKVRGGSSAVVKFPAFSARSTPRLVGTVTTVSAAAIQDTSAQGHTYFQAQIELPADQLARIGQDHHLVPGMPAEVYIETHERSILSYVAKPITDLWSKFGRDG